MGLGALLIFVGVALVSSSVVVPLARVPGWPATRIGGAAGTLARDNARRNPPRTASTAAALMIGLALVTLVATLATSIINTFNSAVDDLAPGQFYAITAQNNFSPIPIAAGNAAAKTPGLESISNVRAGDMRVFGNTRTLTAVDPGLGKVIHLTWKEGSQSVLSTLGATGAFIDDGFAKNHDLTKGSSFILLTPTGKTLTFTVQGIFKPPAGGSPFGPVTISTKTFDANYTQPKNIFTFVTMKGGVTPANTSALETSLKGFPNAKVADGDQFRKNQGAGLKSVLNVLYVLLALSVLVSIFGIVNTLVLTVFERTRELGMLRAIGMSRRQVRRMIRHESVITSLIGAVIGCVLGLVLAALLISRVKEINFFTPWGQLVHESGPGGRVRRAHDPQRARSAREPGLDAIGQRPRQPCGQVPPPARRGAAAERAAAGAPRGADAPRAADGGGAAGEERAALLVRRRRGCRRCAAGARRARARAAAREASGRAGGAVAATARG